VDERQVDSVSATLAAMTDQAKVAAFVRAATLVVIEAAFVAMMASFVWQTWTAKAGEVPDLPSVQSSALAALAVVLGSGYALMLGLPAPENETANITTAIKEQPFLFAGVVIYMLAGFAACLTYGVNEDETPGVIKTIAVAFGGYVIAYVGGAYRQLTA